MKYLMLIYLSLMICFYTDSQQIKDFNPPTIVFEGYLTKVVFKCNSSGREKKRSKSYYRFYIFSEDPLTCIKFRFKKGKNTKEDKLILKDTTLTLVFYGNTFPSSLVELYHKIPQQDYWKSTPKFKEENEIERKKYTINSERVKFEGFNYEDYVSYIGQEGYPPLIEWLIFGKIIYPENVKSGNSYFIANYFWNGNAPP